MKIALCALAAAAILLIAIALLQAKKIRTLRTENENLWREKVRSERMDIYCAHCEHGLVAVEENGNKGVAAVRCGAKAPCAEFSRATTPGQGWKSRWRLR